MNLPPDGTVVSRGSALWSAFRRWPWWGQALLWLVSPVPLLLLTTSKPRAERRPWMGVTLAVTVLWIGTAVVSTHDEGSAEQPRATPTASSANEQHAAPDASTTTTLPASPEGVPRAGNGQDVATGAAGNDSIDRTTASAALLATLNSIPVQAEAARSGYSRDLFPHWDDADHDGCDTRCEVLTSQRRSDGMWFSEWDGYTTGNSTELHVDHVVALAEAWDSGADLWTPAQRDEFADYLPNLLAVTAAENLRKSDSDASQWFPARSDANCLWSSTVVRVKAAWGLSVDQAEQAALVNLLSTCTDFVAPTTTVTTPTTVARIPTTTKPAPPPTSPPTTTQSTVHPGAFCAPEGATGVTTTGLPMTCAGASCDGTPYTQPRWRRTDC